MALSAWDPLNTPERREAGKREQAAPAEVEGTEDIALFPLTIPFTTGPGTMSVAMAFGAGRPNGLGALIGFFVGMPAVAGPLVLVIWITYDYADRIAQLMGPGGSRTVPRLAAFPLLCIGVQILITGVDDVLGPLPTRR